MTYDVIIVGGGIQGVATAYELAKRGAGKILLLEKTILTGGSTGSCAAGIRAQFGSEFNVRLMARSLEIFEHMDEELGYSKEYLELWQGGYMIWILFLVSESVKFIMKSVICLFSIYII